MPGRRISQRLVKKISKKPGRYAKPGTETDLPASFPERVSRTSKPRKAKKVASKTKKKKKK